MCGPQTYGLWGGLRWGSLLYRNCLKRVFDVVVSLAGLVLLSPLILTVGILVRCQFGAPVVFTQTRIGRYGKSFTVLKFRSMNDARDSDGNLLPDDQRLTTFGRLVRRLHLDELLQLWNVFQGEMSCIGPRPVITAYLPDYDAFQQRRLEVRPGMTGWAQVNGNTQLSWDDRIILDVWYIDHLSICLDLRIVAASINVVLFGERPHVRSLVKAKRHAKRLGWIG